MFTLYEHPLSPYARKVKIALWEKALPFESRAVNLLAEVPPDFAAANPRLEVPTLVDDGLAIFDSTIILEYLEDRYPERPLRAADPADRARARMLEEIADTQLEATLWALAEVRFFGRATGERAEAMTADAVAVVGRHFDRLERALAGREYLNGARFGLGDIAHVPLMSSAAFFGIQPGSEQPRLSDWLARMLARESVEKDQAAAMAAVASFGAPSGGGRPLVRQYRDHRLEWMMKHGGADIVRDGLAAGTIKFASEV
jgi:glutathione S-transferase/RNA polymerase-associated protein